MDNQKQQQIKALFAGIQEVLAKELPTPEYAEVLQKDVWIPMRDGVKLCASIYSPKTADSVRRSWPVILVRNPYVGVGLIYTEIICNILPKYGYAVAYVQVRGALKSEGEWLPFEHEREDGRDVIDWIASQSWCNGNIAGFGASYLGHTQWSVADYDHPALKTLFISVYGVHPYPLFYRRGMFRQEVWTDWAASMMGENRFITLTPKDGVSPRKAAFSVQPQSKLGKQTIGEDCDWYRNWITNTAERDTYWSRGFWKEFERATQNIKIPLYLHGGWYDIFLRSQIDSWRRLPQAVKQQSRFLIGPWHHSGMTGGPLNYPDENRAGLIQIKAALEWFDHYLKGKAYPHQVGCIEAYSVGDAQWKVWDGDFAPSAEQTFYFNCSTQNPGGLSTTVPTSELQTSFTYDPKNPVESKGGTLIAGDNAPGGMPECSTYQPEIGERGDIQKLFPIILLDVQQLKHAISHLGCVIYG